MLTNVRRAVLTLLPLVLLMAAATVAQACPGCKDALAANDPHHQNIVRGYFWSILFMMGMPYVTLCCFGGYLYMLVRNSRNGQSTGAAPTDTSDKPLKESDEPIQG